MYCNKQLSSVSVDANPPEVLFDSLPASGLPYNDRPNGHVGFTQSLQQWRNGLPGKVLQKTNFLSYEVWKSQNLKTKLIGYTRQMWALPSRCNNDEMVCQVRFFTKLQICKTNFLNIEVWKSDRPNGHVGFTQPLQQWRNGLPGKVL